MYDALTRQWLDGERRRAMTATMLANIYRKPHTPALTPDDLLGIRRQAEAPLVRQSQRTPEEEAAYVEAWVRAMGGTVLEPGSEQMADEDLTHGRD